MYWIIFLGMTVRKLDVTDESSISAVAKEFSQVDVLFNCAGYVHQGGINPQNQV